jgi:lipopolysaccharide export LptBFGC system permease protein LptF
MQTAYLLPLTVFALVLAVAALGVGARRRRGYGPFAVGVVAAFALVMGKFVIDSNVAVYGEVAALVGASLWNSWPTKPTTGVPLAPGGTLLQSGGIEKEK